jgi:hypothetical protein
MTIKSKFVLIAALAAVSLASPALAQTTSQHSSGKTHHERFLRSGNLFDVAPGGAMPVIPSEDLPFNFCDGAASCSLGGGGDY